MLDTETMTMTARIDTEIRLRAAAVLCNSLGGPIAEESARDVMTFSREIDALREAIRVNNICHNLHGKVDVHAFADGCAAEQVKLYGVAPDRLRYATAEREADALRSELARLSRELELARRDSERMDWLATAPPGSQVRFTIADDHVWYSVLWQSWGKRTSRSSGNADSVRAAIDAAMLAASAPRQETG